MNPAMNLGIINSTILGTTAVSSKNNGLIKNVARYTGVRSKILAERS
jgi:hypothetical protein